MNHSVWIYILIMAVVSYLLRTLPITLIRKQITNPFLKSFLFYLPYVTLSVMTVPAVFQIAENPLAGAAGLIAACLVAWFTSNLFFSACAACGAVFLMCLIL